MQPFLFAAQLCNSCVIAPAKLSQCDRVVPLRKRIHRALNVCSVVVAVALDHTQVLMCADALYCGEVHPSLRQVGNLPARSPSARPVGKAINSGAMTPGHRCNRYGVARANARRQRRVTRCSKAGKKGHFAYFGMATRKFPPSV